MQVSSTIRAFGAAVIAAVALASAPAMAITGHFSPGGTVTVSGPISITKGTLTLSCSAVFTANLSAAVFTGSAGSTFAVSPAENIGGVTSVTLTSGSLLCRSLSAQNLPWTVQVTGGTYTGSPPVTADTVNLTLVNADIRNSSIGDCVGSLSGAFHTSTNNLVIQATLMTGIDPVEYCHFHGPGTSDNNLPVVLTVSPSQTATISP